MLIKNPIEDSNVGLMQIAWATSKARGVSLRGIKQKAKETQQIRKSFRASILPLKVLEPSKPPRTAQSRFHLQPFPHLFILHLFCIHVCLCATYMPSAHGGQTWAANPLRTGVTSGYELLRGCWESNLSPGEE